MASPASPVLAERGRYVMVAAALIAGVGVAGASAATAGGVPNYLSTASYLNSAGAAHSRLTPSSAPDGADATASDAAAPSAPSATASAAPSGTNSNDPTGTGSDDPAEAGSDLGGVDSDGQDGIASERLVEMQPRAEGAIGAGGGIRGVAGLKRVGAVGGMAGLSLARSGRPMSVARWVNPLPGAPVTSCFGVRWGRLHAGVDLATKPGTPIRAAGAGVVVAAGVDAGYGNAVLINHGDGFLTHYGHMSIVAAHVGQRVSAGEQIGDEGSTGHSTGPHLHFEVHQGAYKHPIEPTQWMHEHGVDIPGCVVLGGPAAR